jgi:hypothetical protein
VTGPIDIGAVRRKHQRFLRAHQAMVEREADDAADQIEHHVRQSPGFKPRTGNLQRRTQARVIRRGKHVIVRGSNNARYANAIEGGARPHVIRARRKKTLRFVGRGGIVFRKAVNHPGNKAYRFLYRATMSAGRVLNKGLQVGMTRLARGF